MNLIVSGWPAAGTSTVSLYLAELLGFRYLSGGDLMKHFGKNIAGVTSGPVYIEYEEKYGKWFDFIWEPYAIWKVEHSDKLLLEAKTAGFFIEDKEQIFEIMIIANQFSREQRAVKDKRVDAEDTIKQRDTQLRERWLGEYNIDIFDVQLIQDNYDLVIDNSGLMIPDELEMILTHLEEDYRFPKDNLSSAKRRIEDLMEKHRDDGKQGLKENLLKQGQIVSIHEVAEDWRNHFQEELKRIPDQMQEVIALLK